MTLRNAFEELGTEGTLRKILRMVTYARDINDRLQVVVQNQPAVTLQNGSTSAVGSALNPVPYANNSWNLVDARAQMMEFSHQSFQAARSRWTIT